MPELLTDAIVLRRSDYRESDRMVTLFSANYGRVDVLARGVRKSGARLRMACELFVTGEFRLNVNGARATLTGFLLREGFFPLREDYERLMKASYALGICAVAIQPGKPDPELFAELQLTLGRMAYSEQSADDLLVRFLLGFAALEGYMPALDLCAVCGMLVTGPARFSPEEGGICHASCAPYGRKIAERVFEYLRSVRDGASAEADLDSISEALSAVRAFVEYHTGARVKAGDLFEKA